MRVFGNLMNRLAESSVSATPNVGMGGTIYMYSDRHAVTVTNIFTPRKIEVQRDKAIRIDTNGMSDSQSYEYEPNPKGEKEIFTLRKDGKWRKTGSKDTVLGLGHRSEYYDYSF